MIGYVVFALAFGFGSGRLISEIAAVRISRVDPKLGYGWPPTPRRLDLAVVLSSLLAILVGLVALAVGRTIGA
jgi:hypothetical protein